MSDRKGFDIAAMAQEIEAHLRAVRQASHQPIANEIARAGLTGPQINVMEVLFHHDGLSLKELRQRLDLAHSTVSGIVDRLEKQGAVERRADSADGRVSRVYLSAGVRHYIKHSLPGVQLNPIVRALERLKPEQQKSILKAVRLLREAMDAA
jgi:DNA-binding MarR family transcriptional regulator